jgi:hypothetical protein
VLVFVLVPEIDLVDIPETIRNERTIRTPSLVEPCLHMWLNCKYGSNLTYRLDAPHSGSHPLYLLSFVSLPLALNYTRFNTLVQGKEADAL